MQFFNCDLHIHSCLSPCADITMTPKLISEKLVELGIDLISITDHNTTGNVRVFSEVVSKKGIRVIPGIEVQTLEDVHILGYFPSVDAAESYSKWLYKKIPDFEIDPEKFGYQLYINDEDNYIATEDKWLGQSAEINIDEAIDSIHDFGGFFAFSHVNRKMGIIYQLGFINIVNNDQRIITEVNFKKDLKSLEFYDNLKKIKSSDAHSIQTLKVPMKISMKKRTFEDLRNCLLNDEGKVELIWD
ncbi:MAG: 3,5-nucleoside bisphosphate phosphatase [Kosmotogales bacterium]|nr:3,5-nucleoside bisphosphate phosphatase [Kosmotogales bacterium]